MFGSVKVRTTRQPGQWRTRWSTATYWISAVFVGLIMVGLIFVMLPSSWFSSSNTPSELPSVGGDTVCAEQAPSSDSSGLLVPSWIMIGAIATPQSATGGPVLQASPRQCFTHSTEGAVYAAASYSAEMTQETSVDKRQAIVEARVSRAKNYSAAMLSATQVPPTVARWNFVGYHVIGESPAATTLELAIRTQTGSVAAITYTMVWDRNDWLVLIPDQGTTVSRPLTDFVGFNPWGAAG